MSSPVCAILQARMSSTRLPGKVLMPLAGEPMLRRQIERIQRARLIDRIIVATSDEPADDPIAALAGAAGVGCYRGSLSDVLDRYYRAAQSLEARPAVIVRLTGDCPVIDPAIIDRVIAFRASGELDYASNAHPPTFPDGLDVEAFTYDALERAWRDARLPREREHVTAFINTRPAAFRLGNLTNDRDLSAHRWTVDEPADYALAAFVYDHLFAAQPAFGMEEILDLLETHPDAAALNRGIRRNAGFL